MQARRSSFLKIEVLLLLLVPLLSAGCSNRLVWGFPSDELAARLAAGDHDLLATVDWTKEDPSDAFSLGAQGPFYLSFILQTMGPPEVSRRMLELAWTRGRRPWKEEAGTLLAAGLLGDKDYGGAIDTARAVLALKPAPALARKAQRTLAEALYWNRDDELALAEANRLDGGDPEVLLFRAVSSMRLARPEARELFLALFLRQKMSALHGRAYSFLASEPGFLAPFTPAERSLLEAKDQFMQGAWVKGIALMESALPAIGTSRLNGSTIFAELGNAYGYAGKQAAGARFIEGLAARLEGQARADALEQAGRLYRKAKEHQKAIAILRAAAEGARLTEQQDRVRWLVLDILFTTEPADMLEQVARDSVLWNVPSYFSDLLEERIADIVAARKWGELARLWKALETNGPAGIRAQLSYILARARQEQLTSRLPGSPAGSPREFFREAVRLSPTGYYGMMAAALLGEMPAQVIPRAEPPDRSEPRADTGGEPPAVPQGEQPGEPFSAPGRTSALDPVTLGFFSYGLPSQVYRRVWGERASLPDSLLLDTARKLNAAGEYRGSLSLVGFLRQRRGLSAAEQQLYYPRAFDSLIDPLAEKVGLAPRVLYALVREESYFDPEAASSVGAIGLSQLMPATAEQVAKKLRMSDPDLRDPATNLEIGARHLKDLLRSVDSVPKALLAYNAGLTRVRTWEKTGRGLPMDLFVESVPFQETRGYVRKILVSAVMYARLYEGEDPRQAAAAFFDLAPLPPEAPQPVLQPASQRRTTIRPD